MFMIELLPSPSPYGLQNIENIRGERRKSPQNIQLMGLIGKILNSNNLGFRSALAESGESLGARIPLTRLCPILRKRKGAAKGRRSRCSVIGTSMRFPTIPKRGGRLWAAFALQSYW
jgi:hypothetical protein